MIPFVEFEEEKCNMWQLFEIKASPSKTLLPLGIGFPFVYIRPCVKSTMHSCVLHMSTERRRQKKKIVITAVFCMCALYYTNYILWTVVVVDGLYFFFIHFVKLFMLLLFVVDNDNDANVIVADVAVDDYNHVVGIMPFYDRYSVQLTLYAWCICTHTYRVFSAIVKLFLNQMCVPFHSNSK